MQKKKSKDLHYFSIKLWPSTFNSAYQNNTFANSADSDDTARN